MDTGGGVIVDNTDLITLPDNVILTCGGSSMLTADNNDYRIFKSGGTTPNLTHAIIIDPTGHDDGMGGTAYYTLALAGNNSGLIGCTVIAGAGALGEDGYPNPFSPTIWYPDCDHTSPTDCTGIHDTGALDMRSAIEERDAFYHPPGYDCSTADTAHPAGCNVAITVGGSHAVLRNVTVLGFGTCLGSDPDKGFGAFAALDHDNVDCNSGFFIKDTNGPHLYDTRARSLLTAGDIRGLNIDSGSSPAGISATGGQYQVRVIDDTSTTPLVPIVGDTVWIAPGHGAESAAGSWTIQSVTSGITCSDMVVHCSNLLLQGSVSGGVTLTGGIVNTAPVNGTPATAITGLNFTVDDAPLVAVGQQVSDAPTSGPACIPFGTTVTAVWPARGIVYISQTPTCPATGDSITFMDTTYSGTATNCSTLGPPPPPDGGGPTGCAIFDAAFRFGDGFYLNNAGGLEAVGCTAYEHEVAFHLTEGVNNNRYTNCATGDNVGLPDRNLAGLHYAGSGPFLGNILSLWIEGAHLTGDDPLPDACDLSWSNAILGQHRPYAVVIQSNCAVPDKFTNMNLGVNENGGQNASVEVDAGSLSLVNASSNGPDKLFKADGQKFGTDPTLYPAQLSISNNNFPDAQLYVENTHAASSIVGCGNTFVTPTPYLCAPSSFTQLPGGRLTLTQTQPVMQSDVTGTATIYYVPFVSQQISIYSPSGGTFGLADMTPTGLTFNLNGAKHASSTTYDLFAETLNSVNLELCSGPAWSSASLRSVDVTQINGVWVNKGDMHCDFGSGSTDFRDCLPNACTYLGSFHTASSLSPTVSQQFNPAAASGGSAPCLCLYNAYNRVTVNSQSLDSEAAYPVTTTWRAMGGTSAKNLISVVDGLGQMPVSAKLSDAIKTTSVTNAGAFGIDFNVAAGAPGQFAQSSSTTTSTYDAILVHAPQMGLWTAQAMESAVGTATLGGSGYQQLSVTVAD